MRVLSIWKASTIRSSISFIWSGMFCGISFAGRGMLGLSRVGRQPSMRSCLRRGIDALLDVAHRFEIFVELLTVAAADLGLQVVRLLQHRIQDAAVEFAALAIAHQLSKARAG